MESTCQVTVGSGAFCTLRLNCAVAPVATCAAGADTVTVGAGGGGAGFEAGGGSPPVVAAQEIRASGASKSPSLASARADFGGAQELLLDGARNGFKSSGIATLLIHRNSEADL